ncbi:MAG: hypothetical protein P8179_19330 [Candidatus Thiodiazotropha sp.]
MKTITSGLFSLCALGLFANTTLAGTVSITQDTSEYFLNDTVTLSIDGSGFSESVFGAGFTLSWDPSILSYTGTSIDNPPWATSAYVNTSASIGTLDRIFVGSSSGAGTDFALADITFTALALGTTDVLIGPSGGGCIPGACGVFSMQGELLTDFTPTQVNVVPIPAAAWLFGSGVAGLIGLSRRRNSLNLEK